MCAANNVVLGNNAPKETPGTQNENQNERGTAILTASRVKRVLLKELDGGFGRFGFARFSDKFHGDEYCRPTPDGRQSISLTLYPGKTCLELDAPQVGVRFDRVEELVAKFEEPHPSITAKNIAGRTTASTSLKVFNTRQILKNEQDAARAAVEFVPRAMKGASAFWEQFSSPAEMLKLFSVHLDRTGEYSVIDMMRAERAIAAAIILGERGKAREIADMAQSRLQGQPLDQFKKWAEKALFQ
jgi:hypothetical protein